MFKGLSDAKIHADELGIKLINAIEFAGFYIDREVHILGLFVDITNKDFVEKVESIEQCRIERNTEMIRRFNEIDIPMTIDDLDGGDKSKVITRSHFAQYLVKNKYVSTKEVAFRKYLRDGCKTYLPREYYNTKDVIEIIHNAGGIAILAHPTLYKLPRTKVEILVNQLKTEGLDGIEGYYSTYTKSEERFILKLAKKYDLSVSGGSDFHGSVKIGLDLMVGYGSLKIPEDVLENILVRHNIIL